MYGVKSRLKILKHLLEIPIKMKKKYSLQKGSLLKIWIKSNLLELLTSQNFLKETQWMRKSDIKFWEE